MIVKMLSVMMALLLCAGNCGEIEPSHVDLDFTEYGVQITYDDGIGSNTSRSVTQFLGERLIFWKQKSSS